MTSPTQRTLEWLREDEWEASVVEHWCPHSRRRKDLFGFADIVAFKPEQVLLVQCTSTSNLSSRVTKILNEPVAQKWLLAGDLLVIGWKKYAKPVDGRWWRPTLRWIHYYDFDSD